MIHLPEFTKFLWVANGSLIWDQVTRVYPLAMPMINLVNYGYLICKMGYLIIISVVYPLLNGIYHGMSPNSTYEFKTTYISCDAHPRSSK